MKRFLICLIASFAAILPNIASAQLLNDSANVKILKARAQLLHQNADAIDDDANERLGDQLNNVGGRVDCGSVDIGNQVISSGIGQDVSVIITGDIINTGNRCSNTNRQ
jgi:erythromycin esterase-like protein